MKDGDTWESVANQWQVDAGNLIRFNFHLPDGPYDMAVVNWYLRHHVGCKFATMDRKNWRFSSNAQPGWLFIPPVRGAFYRVCSAKMEIQSSFQRPLAPDGTQIPLPGGKVRPGAIVVVCGDWGHGYKVLISHPSGLSHDIKGLIKAGGTGLGVATGKQIAKRIAEKGFIKTVGGFLGGRIGGGIVSIFVPSQLAGAGDYSMSELLPNGVLVEYYFFE